VRQEVRIEALHHGPNLGIISFEVCKNFGHTAETAVAREHGVGHVVGARSAQNDGSGFNLQNERGEIQHIKKRAFLLYKALTTPGTLSACGRLRVTRDGNSGFASSISLLLLQGRADTKGLYIG